MAEVNFYLRDTKAQKDTGIMLYFSFNGKRMKVKSVDKINPKFWDSGDQRAKQTKSFPTHPEFNQRLKDIANVCLDTYRKYLNDHHQEQPSPAQIKHLILAGLNNESIPETEPLTLYTFIEQFIERSKNRINDKTGKPLSKSIFGIYNRTLRLLKQYAKARKVKLDFEDISLDFYFDFKDYLSIEQNFSTNTVGKHIKTLKTFLNDATEMGVNTKTDFKRKRFKVTSEPVENIYLNEAELEAMFNLDLAADEKLERVRDSFLVGCWTGLRYGDFIRIGKEHIIDDPKCRLIEITTQKTQQKVVIPIHWTVEKIFKRHSEGLGAYRSSVIQEVSNPDLNLYIKDVAKLAGITDMQQKRITKKGHETIQSISKHLLVASHTGRRSFATNMYLMGVPTLSIMAVTNHKTEKAFMKYIKLTPREHAHKVQEIWQMQSRLRKVE